MAKNDVAAANKQNFFIGTYSQGFEEGKTSSQGIYSCSIDLSVGTFYEPVCAARCVNPSYLAWGANKKYLYAVKEVLQKDGPGLLAFEVGKTGGLQPINSVEMDGEAPCHLSVDKTGQFLASAQYVSGNALIYRLQKDGHIGGLLNNIQHQGSGPDAKRQEGPHAHFVRFLSNPDEFVVVDLGLDRVFVYEFDVVSSPAKAFQTATVTLPPGAGPRHLVCTNSQNNIYVYCEMRAEICHFARTSSNWSKQRTVHAFEKSRGINDWGAAIRLSADERFLYVSERTRSQISCFSIDPINGNLTPIQSVETGGDGPRDFNLTPDGKFVVVANEQSNSLCSFRRDLDTGLLEKTGHSVMVENPVCLLF